MRGGTTPLRRYAPLRTARRSPELCANPDCDCFVFFGASAFCGTCRYFGLDEMAQGLRPSNRYLRLMKESAQHLASVGVETELVTSGAIPILRAVAAGKTRNP
jgi:hypothetical protein